MSDSMAPHAAAESLELRCVVTWPGFDPGDATVVGRLQEAGIQVELAPKVGARSPAEVAALMKGATAAIVSTDPFDRSVFAAAPLLRVVARTGTGTDSIDLEAATEAGVVVTITRGAHEEVVADHTMALLLAATRRVVENDASVRKGQWDRAARLTPWQLTGCTVGLVGVGRVGRAVSRRLQGFDCHVLAFDPAVRELSGVDLVPLKELLQRSDIVSIHVPLTSETRTLLGRRELSALPSHAILVNTSRGGIVDERWLVRALREGRLRAAALDVFEDEPPVDSGLIDLPNVVLSPHIGGLSSASIRALTRQAVASVLDILLGRTTSGIVNPQALDHSRQRVVES